MATPLQHLRVAYPAGNLVNRYSEALKRGLDGELDGATDQVKACAVREVIRSCSSAAALIVLQPVPVVDVALITPVQYRMVQTVGRIHGYVVDRTLREEIFKPLRGKLIKLNAIIAGVKLVPFIPFVGDVVAMSVAYALTSAIGELSDRHFRSGRTIPVASLTACFDGVYREQYERTYRQKRNELKAMWKTRAVREQLAQLKRERSEGRITEDEADRRIEELLGPH